MKFTYTLSILVAMLLATASFAETTTTTTTTDEDGSTTTTVEETTTTDDNDVDLIGPTGVTGTIRRSDRRQDRRDGDAHIDRR